MSERLDMSARNGFSRNPLDRRSEKRGDPAVLSAALADVRARALVFVADLLLVDRAQDAPGLFDMARAKRLGADIHEAVLLGWMPDGEPRFAVSLPEAPAADDDLTLVDLRTLALDGLEGRFPEDLLGQAAQARSMLGWHERHGFCANCGRVTTVTCAGYRRDCAHCQAQHFPRTDPVAIMLVTNEDRALLGRQARFKPGSYSCLAGFVEPGETIEDAVRRETYEEAGVRVGRVSYISSQPWPFVSSLMIGCLAEAMSTDLVLDREELEDARWFSRSEVAAMVAGTHPDGLICPPPLAIARRLIEFWLQDKSFAT